LHASPRTAVNQNKARAEEIKGILEARRSGKEGNATNDPLRTKLNGCRDKFKELVKQKQVLRAQFEAATKTRDAARDTVKELKAMIKFKDVENIESEVQRLEEEISHSSLSLSEEKKVMESIRQLKNSKAVVAEYSAKMEGLAADETACKEINAAIKSLDTEINAVRKEEDGVRAQLGELRKKEEASGTDNKSLWDEKEKCREACKEAYEKIKDLRAKHDAQWQEFKAQEKLWRAQQAVDKARKREEYLKEKAARDAEWAAREKEMRPEPYSEDIIKCDQLSAYLNKLTGEGEVATSKDQASDAPQALDGMTAFVKKEDPEFAWMKGSGNGAAKKKGKNGKKGKGLDKPADQSKTKLVHSVDIIAAFASLKLSVPITMGDCEGLLRQVGGKKEEFLKKQALSKEAEETAVHENATFEVESAKETDSPAAKETDEQASAEKDSANQRKGKTAKSAKRVALKLDDESSWPSMGGVAPLPVANGVSRSMASVVVDVAAESEANGGLEMEEGEVLPTPKNGNAIALSITVGNGGKCEVHVR
jgi:uncharacterized coiled-coil DUF342 family protein